MSEANKGFDPIKLIRKARDPRAWAKLNAAPHRLARYQRVQDDFQADLLAIALYRRRRNRRCPRSSRS